MDYNKYYENQVGSGIPVFQGARQQRGYGLGSIFRKFFGWVMPIFKTHALPMIKRGAQTVGTEAIRSATNIATDALSGKDIQTAAKERTIEALDNLSNKAQGVLQSGSGKKYKRPKKRKLPLIFKKKQIKKSHDIFD
jgi:hypothetical protein